MMMMMVVVQRGRVPGGAAEPLPSVPLPLLLLHLLLFLGPIWAEGGRRAATPWASQAQPETPPLKETASAEGKMEGSTTGSHSPTGLSYAVAASQILGLAVVTMMGAWMGHFRGGLAWDSPQLQFNVHPLCMTLGMVFLQADALLVFRVFRNESKRATKILHGLLHSLALVVALVGLVAVFQYHKKQNFPDLYSLHSWCGILAFSFYFLQWLVGLGFFLFPGASFSLRSWYKPQHAFLGAAIFLLSVATALLGILELLLFKIKDTYGSFAPEGVLANALGLLLAAFGAILGYILTREEWRRPLRGEEMALSMDFKTLTEEEPGERSPADPR
ncbi:transmembrane ascorbate-dependent reductase CYB561 isoform X2 [Sceloporus undulatus]|uniref:transmembrane ascorbate-dependent reductase CYB561 isoform X2 n=1 Tax=Sceloporus undulatus TaxID=8520 RepID=UPI001C4B3E58|nr:transmembrane ascorbate-dependent reductase CYB561 isoform X2 [Sceloporus undulatus]